MRVVTVAAPKGGSCKSTTTSLLATRAAKESARVAMFDLNVDQANLTQWWFTRGQPMNPHLIRDIQNITRDVEVLRASRFEWLFIDTPSNEIDLIENAVSVADAVVVPVRASIFDVGAVEAVVEMCKAHHKPYAFLLSAVDSKFKKLNETAVAALINDGQILHTRISYRLPYINALTAGKAGFEIEPDLVPEADALWSEVKRLVNANPQKAVRGHAAQ